MKIEVGKKYRMRDGGITGVIYQDNLDILSDGENFWWVDSGRSHKTWECPTDIVGKIIDGGWSDWATTTPKDYFSNLIKGKDYECSYVDGVFKYRVKDPEPEVKEVVNYFCLQGITNLAIDSGFTRLPEDTHKITIKIIDGVIQPQALIEAL